MSTVNNKKVIWSQAALHISSFLASHSCALHLYSTKIQHPDAKQIRDTPYSLFSFYQSRFMVREDKHQGEELFQSLRATMRSFCVRLSWRGNLMPINKPYFEQIATDNSTHKPLLLSSL